MAIVKLFDLARMTTATTGTGTLTLGAAVAPFLTFAQAGVADGDTVRYSIIDGTANSEAGTGVYTASGTTLTRTVLKSTNSNNAINLSGTAQVIITALAEDFALLAPLASPALTGNVTVGQPISNRAALNVGGVTGPGVVMTKHGNLAQLVCAPADFNLRDLPPAAQYDGDVVISRGSLVFTSTTASIFSKLGFFGINTTSPAAQLDITSTTAVATRGVLSSQFTTDAASAFFLGRKARGTAASPTAVAASDFITVYAPSAWDGSAWQQGGAIGFQVSGGGGVVSGSAVPTDFVVFTGSSGNGAERLRITAAGAATFVGSLTANSLTLTTPLAAIQGGSGFASYAVGDLLYASSTTTLSKLADIATGNALISGGVGAAPSWSKITTSHTTGIAASGANTDITSLAGNLTIGSGATSGFSPTLTVLHATGAYVSVKSGSNPEIIFGSDTSTYGILGTFSNHSLGFRTNNTLRMTLNTSGDLSISSTTASTTTTTGALVVSGGLGVAGAINGGGALTVSGLVTASNATNATNTATGAIQTAGGLGVVQDIWGGGILNVSGQATVGSGTATPSAGSLTAGLRMGAVGVGVFWGTGAPTFTAPKGSLYINVGATTTTTRLYVNTNAGSTWANFTASA